MTIITKTIITAAVFTLSASASFAQNSNSSAGFYGGVEAGMGLTKDTTNDVARAFVNGVGGAVSVTQDSSVFTGRGFAGYQVNENFSAELGYSQSSKVTTNVSGVSGGSVAYTGKADLSYSGLDYSVLVRPSVSTGANGVFFRLGGHSLTQTANLSITAISTASVTLNKSGTGSLWGVGYDLPTSGKNTVRIEYTSFNGLAGGTDSQGIFSVGLIAKF